MGEIATDSHTFGQRDTFVPVKGNLLLTIQRGEFWLLSLTSSRPDSVVLIIQTQLLADPDRPETAWRADSPDLPHVALLRSHSNDCI